VQKEVAATAGPCNFWQHSIRQYIFYMQIGTTTRNLPTAHLVEADGENAGTFRRMNSGPPWPQALLEVCLCCGAPTQLLVGGILALAGLHAGPDGQLTLRLLAFVIGLDSVLLVSLVLSLLVLGGESPRQVLLGARRIPGEILRGFALVPWVFLLFAVTGIVLHRIAPGLFIPNPFATIATTRAEYVLFGVVVLLGGGVREEIQRAFILHRCEQRLGGVTGAITGLVGIRVPPHRERMLGALLGVVGFGLLFGLMHVVQGWSVVIITALLGTLWNVTYLVRRSVVAPMVSHASFNLIQVIAFWLLAGASAAAVRWA
jgi:membrane protease YdiL (CAAX protease family)